MVVITCQSCVVFTRDPNARRHDPLSLGKLYRIITNSPPCLCSVNSDFSFIFLYRFFLSKMRQSGLFAKLAGSFWDACWSTEEEMVFEERPKLCAIVIIINSLNVTKDIQRAPCLGYSKSDKILKIVIKIEDAKF